MDWLFAQLDVELLRLSKTPLTTLTLILVVLAASVGVALGPFVRAAARRVLIRDGDIAPNVAPVQGRFGTFGGVFTPSILTILGVVMYLRMGWVVGNVGLGGTLLIVGVSHLITIATGLSVSSIATNRRVGAGGAYFIISRSLGAPVGAAIGIPLFFGQALSVTFYLVGFSESLAQILPGLPEKMVSSAVLVVLTLVSLKSADLALFCGPERTGSRNSWGRLFNTSAYRSHSRGSPRWVKSGSKRADFRESPHAFNENVADAALRRN